MHSRPVRFLDERENGQGQAGQRRRNPQPEKKLGLGQQRQRTEHDREVEADFAVLETVMTMSRHFGILLVSFRPGTDFLVFLLVLEILGVEFGG